MCEAEFDKFADEYRATHARNIALSGEPPEFFAEYKAQDLAALLGDPPPLAPRLLDFGAGVGSSVPWFHKHLLRPNVTCLDVSRKSLAIAAERLEGLAQFQHFDSGRLPLPDDSLNVAFAASVFHHIPQVEHPALLRELRRVLRPGAQLVIFEHNPLNPLTVRAVNVRCQPRFLLFFPHFARWMRPLERWLGWLPLGARHFICGAKHAAH